METFPDLFAPAPVVKARAPLNAPVTGQIFGRLTAIAEAPKRDGYRFIVCRCECGKEKTIALGALRKGATRSCGCFRADRLREVHTKHGHISQMTGASTTYRTWSRWRSACHNPNHVEFAGYGARGYTMCDEWRAEFVNFLRDLGEQPKGHTLRLIGASREFAPNKCAWSLR